MRDIFSRDEIRDLVTPSDWKGAMSLLITWGLIAASVAGVALWPTVPMIVAALIVIGGRQLALAVLMHECSHRSLFRSRALNDVVGHWLCGAPVWTHMERYRPHHLAHHSHTNTERDPDRGLTAPFPATRWALIRKMLRDVTGVSGLRRLAAVILMDLGAITYTASTGARRTQTGGVGTALARFVRLASPVLFTNALIFVALWAALGTPLGYLLWLGAWLTTFGLFLRVRAIAEHACASESSNPLHNTRTTAANWLARLTVAPHHVNYHLEHHLLMTVPHYHLPAMHSALKARGVLDDAVLAPGYLSVLREASSAT